SLKVAAEPHPPTPFPKRRGGERLFCSPSPLRGGGGGWGLLRQRPAPSSCVRARRKGSASVTTPTVWTLPRSVSFVTVAGLMSTHATLTQAGSRLPVAIECSMVATIRQKPTP